MASTSKSSVIPISINAGNVVEARASALLIKTCKDRCPHWTNVVLWAIGLLVMAGLTIKDLTPLIEDYFDDDENMEVQIKTKQIIGPHDNRPNLYIDIPVADDLVFLEFSEILHNYLKFGEPCKQCDLMANNSFDVWNEWNRSEIMLLTNTSETARKLVISFLKRLIQIGRENTTAILRYKNLDWNRPLVYSLASFVSNQTAMMSAFSEDGTRQFETLLVEITRAQYLWLRSALYSIFCEVTYLLADVDATGIKLQSDDRCVDMVQHSVGRDANGIIILRLSPALNRTDYFGVRLQFEYFEAFLGKRYERIRLYNGDSMNTYGLEELFYASQKELEKVNYELIMVSYSPQTSLVEERSSVLRSCSNDQDQTFPPGCARLCNWRHIESICNCRFLEVLAGGSSKETDDDFASTYCNRADYERCSDLLRNATIDCSQGNKCPKACRTFKYDYRVVREGGVKNKSSFNLGIVATGEPYLEFAMKQKDLPESLVSQIGGVFNFYLGFSGLSVFSFLVYLIDSWRRWRESRRIDQEPESAQDPAHRELGDWIWKWRWFYLTASKGPTTSVSTSGIATSGHKASDKFAEFDQKVSDKFRALDQKVHARLTDLEQKLSRQLKETRNLEIRKRREMKSVMQKRFNEMMHEIQGKLVNMVQAHTAELKGPISGRIKKRTEMPSRKQPI